MLSNLAMVPDESPRAARMPRYTLPELGYEFAALEPHLSAGLLRRHHGEHHAACVGAANRIVAEIAESPAHPDPDGSRLRALEKSLAFHVSGHVLHSMLWKNLTPGGGGRPDGALRQALDRDFGSFDIFRRRMIETAFGVMGAGWAALVWDPLSRCLITARVYDHQPNLHRDGLPIMVLDSWDHAFGPPHPKRRSEYLEAVWSLWNWDDIGRRFETARRARISWMPRTHLQVLQSALAGG